MNHTNGWLDGRRDVDLDGDWRTGSSPAGRRDYQGVQEIIVRSRPACEMNFYARRKTNADQIIHWQNRE